jgi:hypothetical protein
VREKEKTMKAELFWAIVIPILLLLQDWIAAFLAEAPPGTVT